MITHRVDGLERFAELLYLLERGRTVIKVVCNVGELL